MVRSTRRLLKKGWRWNIYRMQTGYIGLGYARWPSGWSVTIGPWCIGREAGV